MLRSKRGPALFDYISPGGVQSGPVRLPRWWRRPADEKPATPVSRSPVSPVVTVVPPVAVTTDGPETKKRGSSLGPWIEVDDDRVRVSLTSLTGAGAIFVLLMLVLAAFEVGKRRGESAGLARGFEEGKASLAAEPPMDELEAVRQQAPALEVVRGLLKDPSTTSGKGTPAVAANKPAESLGKKAGADRWIKGKTYVVVQEFAAGNEEHGRQAQAYLATKNVPAALVKMASGSVRLITTEGFNRQDASERRVSEQVLARVHALGEEYYRDGGGYKLQGYFATLKGDAW